MTPRRRTRHLGASVREGTYYDRGRARPRGPIGQAPRILNRGRNVTGQIVRSRRSLSRPPLTVLRRRPEGPWERPLPPSELQTRSPACTAPWTSLYFDPSGDVRACCQNVQAPLGNITEGRLTDFWWGSPARRIRAAIWRHDYSEGCGFCGWQVREAGSASAFARTYDHLTLDGDLWGWPARMEFALSNACNLQCTMCNGDLSSSIRTHREHRPPLPKAYGDSFFEDLRTFVPHLREVAFLGGEPLLAQESLRVMELLGEEAYRGAISLTTNGTVWTPRVERIAATLPLDFVISIDGFSSSLYESIRIGADRDQVFANLEHFESSARRHGTSVSIAFCLMTCNWHEFAELAVFAESRGFGLNVNTVIFPLEASLYSLGADDLQRIVAALERQAETTAAGLVALKPVFDEQLGILRQRAEGLRAGEVPVQISPTSMRAGAEAEDQLEVLGDALREWAGTEVGWVLLDEGDRIVAVDELVGSLVGESDLIGQGVLAILESMRVRFGSDVRSWSTPDPRFVESAFHDAGGRQVAVIRTASLREAGGPGTRLVVAIRNEQV